MSVIAILKYNNPMKIISLKLWILFKCVHATAGQIGQFVHSDHFIRSLVVVFSAVRESN